MCLVEQQMICMGDYKMMMRVKERKKKQYIEYECSVHNSPEKRKKNGEKNKAITFIRGRKRWDSVLLHQDRVIPTALIGLFAP